MREAAKIFFPCQDELVGLFPKSVPDEPAWGFQGVDRYVNEGGLGCAAEIIGVYDHLSETIGRQKIFRWLCDRQFQGSITCPDQGGPAAGLSIDVCYIGGYGIFENGVLVLIYTPIGQGCKGDAEPSLCVCMCDAVSDLLRLGVIDPTACPDVFADGLTGCIVTHGPAVETGDPGLPGYPVTYRCA